MRNFDEERAQRFSRERSFTIGGETFTFKIGMHPDSFNDRVAEYETVTLRTGGNDAVRIYSDTIASFLQSDDDRERWRVVRDKRADVDETDDPSELALTAEDLLKVLMWIFEEQTGGRPTQAPASSGNGQRRSGQTSTELSSSPPVVSAA